MLHRRPCEGAPVRRSSTTTGSARPASSRRRAWCAPSAEGDASAAPPIGAAIDGVNLAVVDDALQSGAAGEPGELLIGGVSVALGYLDEPELTARAFVDSRLSDGAAARWYRTGDLVRRLPDGAFEHLGRIDEQVQVRGSRVELGEVAASLDRHPSVGTSVVAVRGEGVHQRLVAYVVPAADAAR